jgi:hypothetical protein
MGGEVLTEQTEQETYLTGASMNRLRGKHHLGTVHKAKRLRSAHTLHTSADTLSNVACIVRQRVRHIAHIAHISGQTVKRGTHCTSKSTSYCTHCTHQPTHCQTWHPLYATEYVITRNADKLSNSESPIVAKEVRIWGCDPGKGFILKFAAAITHLISQAHTEDREAGTLLQYR